MKNTNIKSRFILLLLSFSCVLSAQSFKLPSYTKFKLSNGLTVSLMEQHDVPIISVSAILPAGAIYDSNKVGLASLTATALKHGTKNFPKAKLDGDLDFLGANINTSATKEFAGLSSDFGSKDKSIVLTIIKEVLLNPTFDEAEFEKEKSRLLVNLGQQKESPRSVIGAYFDTLLYGNHVYANVKNGNKTSIENLNVNDVKAFYKTNYKPNDAAINIVGDFNSKEMKAIITKLFSTWEKSAVKNDNLASKPITKPQENNVLLVNKSDAKETTFFIGAPGVSRKNPDYIAIEVVNTLFGGRFTSMLNDELRVNSGLTYGAGSRFNNLKYGGSFYISTFTANKTTEAAIDKALEVLQKLHSNGIDEKALASAKNYVKGQFPTNYETTDQLAGLLSQMFWYDFDASFINNFEKNVDSLDLNKANEIIENYFPKDKLQFIMIGNAEEIKSIAEKHGKVKVVDIADDINKLK
jgi:zinc protease